MTSPAEEPQSIFASFVGSGRSGTTLVRAMFDSHPLVAVAPEAPFVVRALRRRSLIEQDGAIDVDRLVNLMFRPGFDFEASWAMSRADVVAIFSAAPLGSVPDAIRSIFRAHATRCGKPLYADKTPGNVVNLPELANNFDEMRFVHVVRDGRDVALSYVDAPFGGESLGVAAIDWARRVRAGRTTGAALGSSRYTELHYEELVRDPEATLRAICPFVGLEFSEEMLSYTENAASLLQTIPYPSAHQSLLRPPTVGLRDWRRDLSESDRGLVEVLAGHELRALGYSVSRVPVWSRVRALVVRIRFLALSARSRYRLRRSARAKVRR